MEAHNHPRQFGVEVVKGLLPQQTHTRLSVVEDNKVTIYLIDPGMTAVLARGFVEAVKILQADAVRLPDLASN